MMLRWDQPNLWMGSCLNITILILSDIFKSLVAYVDFFVDLCWLHECSEGPAPTSSGLSPASSVTHTEIHKNTHMHTLTHTLTHIHSHTLTHIHTATHSQTPTHPPPTHTHTLTHTHLLMHSHSHTHLHTPPSHTHKTHTVTCQWNVALW